MMMESFDRWNKCFYRTWRGANCFLLRSIHLVVALPVLDIGAEADDASLWMLLMYNYSMKHNEDIVYQTPPSSLLLAAASVSSLASVRELMTVPFFI